MVIVNTYKQARITARKLLRDYMQWQRIVVTVRVQMPIFHSECFCCLGLTYQSAGCLQLRSYTLSSPDLMATVRCV